jgi:carbon monoxide dehydrogenase subunit G
MRYHLQFEKACVAPPQEVFDLLVNVERWPDWLTAVKSATWEDPGDPGTHHGAIRRIVVSGLTMRERVLVADRPHHHAYTILSGIPVADHRADVRILGHGEGSLIVWQAAFAPKRPPLGPLIWLMLRVSMPRMVADLVNGAERAATD